jgi:phosphatidylglycerol---prolipoprotein diacylglyceryl transferase
MLPIILNWQGLIIYSYPLFIGLSWGVAFRIAESLKPKEIQYHHFLIYMFGLFIFSWIGAKTLFLITQDQWNSSELMISQSFWLGGGFVFYGGLLGGGLFSLISLYVLKNWSLKNSEFLVVPLTMGHAIGRVGCFLAGCCFGSKTSSVIGTHLHGALRHPVQLYEAGGLVLIALGVTKLKNFRLPFYLICYGLLRFGLEFIRGDEIRGGWLELSTSQWISLLLILLGMIQVIYSILLGKSSSKQV